MNIMRACILKAPKCVYAMQSMHVLCNRLIVIVNFEFLKRYLKTKCRAPAYSQALRRVRRSGTEMSSEYPSWVAREQRDEAKQLLRRVSLRTRKLRRRISIICTYVCIQDTNTCY